MLRSLILGVTLVLAASLAVAQSDPEPFEVLITGGQVIDGTGGPGFYADVGLRDGRIVAVGELRGHPAGRVIDAEGRVVAPGFIDLHSHADDAVEAYSGLRHEDARRRAAPNLVMQGITTVVVNQDGRSPWPIREQRDALLQGGIGVNAVLLVGHGTVRHLVMGPDFRRAATPEEVDAMRALVRQGMDEGAYGLSAGLEYMPGRWSTTDELVALVEESAAYGGVYIAHQRSEGADPMWYWPTQDSLHPPTLVEAVRETIEIGERTGATVVASHLKAKGVDTWGTSRSIVHLIEKARARGVSIWADQYPYTTSGTDGHTVLIPDWIFAVDRWNAEVDPKRGLINYTAQLRKALADPDTAVRVRRDVAHEIRRRGGADHILVIDHPKSVFVGRSLGELAAERSISAVEMAFQLQFEGSAQQRGGGRLRGFSMTKQDLDAYSAQPWVATITDGGIALPDDPLVHPRFYGAFPRKIGCSARDEGVLSVPAAIRSATSLPAQILDLSDRGLIREGYQADLIIFDPDAFRDTATFTKPHQYPTGIDYVFVGGTAVVEQGTPTFALPGTVIRPSSIGAPPVEMDVSGDR